MAHFVMPDVQGYSKIRPLVWLRVSLWGLVRSEGGKGYLTIVVIANVIIFAVEPDISNDLVIFRYFAWMIRPVEAAFLQAAEGDEVQWKIWNIGHII